MLYWFAIIEQRSNVVICSVWYPIYDVRVSHVTESDIQDIACRENISRRTGKVSAFPLSFDFLALSPR